MILDFNAINRRNDLVARASERSNCECRVNVSTLWPQPIVRRLAHAFFKMSTPCQMLHTHPTKKTRHISHMHAKHLSPSIVLSATIHATRVPMPGKKTFSSNAAMATFLPTLTTASSCVFLMKSTTPDMSLVWRARRSVRRGVT